MGDQDIDRRPPAFYIVPKEETVRIREGQVLTQDKEEFPVILNVQRWSALLGRRSIPFNLIQGLKVTETLAKILEDESVSQRPRPGKSEVDQLQEVRAAWMMSKAFVVGKT